MKFDLDDMRQFAERHRGKHRTSGPHWSTIIRFPILFDEYKKTLTRAEKAEAELAALREQTRWIPVGERLPDENAGVFAVSEDEVYGTRTVVQGDYCQGKFLDLAGDDIENVTHWMPIPEPPEDK